jgi:hypothetical protein
MGSSFTKFFIATLPQASKAAPAAVVAAAEGPVKIPSEMCIFTLSIENEFHLIYA